jgi:NAD(P)H-hydrate repair Nnr-like enzyme with NAD(P)H-hydrate dehydratase domain
LIADPDGRLNVNTTSNPGMATGGAGDVLTGLLAALLAQHLEPLMAAACGAYVHGLAGDLAASETGRTGLIATDLIAHLPRAIAQCQKGIA